MLHLSAKKKEELPRLGMLVIVSYMHSSFSFQIFVDYLLHFFNTLENISVEALTNPLYNLPFLLSETFVLLQR